jgi:hypothetical protein
VAARAWLAAGRITALATDSKNNQTISCLGPDPCKGRRGNKKKKMTFESSKMRAPACCFPFQLLLTVLLRVVHVGVIDHGGGTRVYCLESPAQLAPEDIAWSEE